jgi:hypothetical protein
MLNPAFFRMPICLNEKDRKIMEVKTFTQFWNTERKLYAIYDIALPVPISLKVVGAFVVAGIPWWGLLWLVHAPFGNPSYLLWIIPPAGLGYIASKPLFQRKTMIQFAESLFRFYGQPKRLAGLRKPQFTIDDKHKVTAKVFTRTPLSKEE